MGDRLGLLQAVRGVIVANVPDGFVPVRHYAGLECWARGSTSRGGRRAAR